jgi:hypothetical protein
MQLKQDMKYKLIIIIAAIVLLGSCASTKDKLNITESYSLISSSFQLSKDSWQKFIDKGSASLDIIKNNTSAKVDTKELGALLDSSKATNQKSMAMINLAADVNSIKYKEKALRYINLLNKLYSKEFQKYIDVLAIQSDDRYERAYKLLTSRQEQLSHLDKRFIDAADEVKEKYHLQLDSTKLSK